jgi:hypothetical protein
VKYAGHLEIVVNVDVLTVDAEDGGGIIEGREHIGFRDKSFSQILLKNWRYFRSFECRTELVNVKCVPNIHIREFMMQQCQQTGSDSVTV